MTAPSKVSLMLVAGLVVGCRPSAQSSADTSGAATSSTIPAVIAGSSNSVLGRTSGQTSTATVASGSKKTKDASMSAKSSGSSTRRNGNAPPDSGIIGYDSVIRFPHRWPATSSSTPIRK